VFASPIDLPNRPVQLMGNNTAYIQMKDLHPSILNSKPI
jgi:hypothetical protein